MLDLSLPRRARLLPVAIPLLYVLILFLVSPLHSLFSEWGGVMQYFAGQEIWRGQGYHGWTSHFWPPLFSVLIGFGSLILPGFAAGKAIAIVSSAVVLYVTYHLSLLLFSRTDFALWSQVFLATNPLYMYESLQAHNHLLDAALFSAGLLIFLNAMDTPSWSHLLLAGMLSGLAGLTRYTSYVLVFLPLSLVFVQRLPRALRSSLVFWFGFTLVSCPWWYSNMLSNGSPFYTWDYLNVCVGVLRNELGLSLHALWRCAGRPDLQGLLAIALTYPGDYVRNVYSNVQVSLQWILTGTLAVFVLPSLLDGFISIRPRYWLVIVSELVLSIFLVSQAYLAPWYLLNWVVLLTSVTVAFLLRYLSRIEQIYLLLRRYRVRWILLTILLVGNLCLSALELRSYARQPSLYYPLWKSTELTRALKARDPDLASKVIMAIDPGRAYHAGAKYLATPLEYEGSVDGLVSYAGLSDALKTYAPKYPSDLSGPDLRADYLVYTNPRNVSPS